MYVTQSFGHLFIDLFVVTSREVLQVL
jgi:hypothetical protein